MTPADRTEALQDVSTVHFVEPAPVLHAAVPAPEWTPEISIGTPTVLVTNHDGSSEPTTPEE